MEIDDDTSVDINDVDTFPAELLSAIERDKHYAAVNPLFDALGLRNAPLGMGDGTDGLYHPDVSAFATNTVVDRMIGLRDLPYEDRRVDLDNNDARLTRLHDAWKTPATYYPPGHGGAAVMPRFRLGEYVPMDHHWMMEYAARPDDEIPLRERRNHMVHYLNNFWVLIDDSPCTVGSKELNLRQPATKRATLITRKLSDFRSVMKNFNLRFRLTDDTYNKEYVQTVRELFGSAAGPRAIPAPRRGRPPSADPGQPVALASVPRFATINAFDLWFNHCARRTVLATTFDPHPEDHPDYPPHNSTVNLWQGFRYSHDDVRNLYSEAIDEDEGSARWRANLMLEHVRDVLCGGDVECFNYVVYQAAMLLQRPWEVFISIPIFNGPEGVGKSMWIEALGEIVGRWQFLATSTLNDVLGNFTERLDGVILLYLNEAYNPNDPQSEANFKNLITSHDFRLNRKFRPCETRKRYFHVMADSNLHSVVQADKGARRWQLIATSTKVPPPAYFSLLYGAMYDDDNLGLRALADYLYSVDLEQGNLMFNGGRKVIKTRLLMHQQMDCLDTVDRFIYDLLSVGRTVDPATVTDRLDPKIAELRRRWTKPLTDHLETASAYLRARTHLPPDDPEAATVAEVQRCTELIRQAIESGTVWLTYVAIEDLMHLYTRFFRTYHRKDATLQTDSSIVQRMRAVLGGEGFVEQIEATGVQLVATEHQRRQLAQVENGDHHIPMVHIKQPRRYVKLPPLHIARANFVRAMGWRESPFEARSLHHEQSTYDNNLRRIFGPSRKRLRDFSADSYSRYLCNMPGGIVPGESSNDNDNDDYDDM